MNASAFENMVDFERIEVAVAHWHVNAWGGAENVATALAETFDCDRIYTVGTPEPAEPNPYGDVPFVDVTADLSPAPLRKLQARVDRVFEYALWEDVDWRAYGSPDVLITSGSTTRAVITPDDTLHLNYCHSPPRWFYDRYHDRKDSISGLFLRPLIRYLRMRDATVDPRVDGYLANSPVVARRISKFYDRDAEVLYPPIDVESYRDGDDEGFYLHLGRLDEEKGVPAVIDAFAGSNHRLVMAGGRGDVDASVFEGARTSDEIDYRGFVSESEKRDLLATCRAVVFNGVDEDFGIVPIEANASGKPVLAREAGFPALFVTDGENGLLHDGTAAGIATAVARLEREGIDGDPRAQVERFSSDAFRNQVELIIVRQLEAFRAI